MRMLRVVLAAAALFAVAGGCAYTAMTSDASGKLYLTRTNIMGIWNDAWVCEPNQGLLNCKPAIVEGAGGAPAADPSTAPEPEPAPLPTPEGGESY